MGLSQQRRSRTKNLLLKPERSITMFNGLRGVSNKLKNRPRLMGQSSAGSCLKGQKGGGKLFQCVINKAKGIRKR